MTLARDAVDRAIAAAIEAAWNDVIRGLPDPAAVTRIDGSVQHIRDCLGKQLANGGQATTGLPDYSDPGNAIAYSGWYGPRQINLAHSTLEQLIDPKDDSVAPLALGRGLFVVDFGAGSHAVAIGLALSVAKAISRGTRVGQIVVHGYDCGSMLKLGVGIWNALKQEARSDDRIGPLATALEQINLQSVVAGADKIPAIRGTIPDGRARLLVGQHVAYAENVLQVRRTISTLFDQFLPDVGIITGPSAKADLVQQVSPSVAGAGWQHVHVPPQLSGPAPATTSCRRALTDRYVLTTAALLQQDVLWYVGGAKAAPHVLRYLKGARSP